MSPDRSLVYVLVISTAVALACGIARDNLARVDPPEDPPAAAAECPPPAAAPALSPGVRAELLVIAEALDGPLECPAGDDAPELCECREAVRELGRLLEHLQALGVTLPDDEVAEAGAAGVEVVDAYLEEWPPDGPGPCEMVGAALRNLAAESGTDPR